MRKHAKLVRKRQPNAGLAVINTKGSFGHKNQNRGENPKRPAATFDCLRPRECGIPLPMLPAILIGALSGVIAALCGVGGGVVMVPLFVAILGFSQKQAVATSLAAMVLTALFSSLKNHANGFVEWKTALPCGLAGAAVAWLTADALKHLQNRTLTTVFAMVMIAMGVRMLFSR
jgi:hypothetical protein